MNATPLSCLPSAALNHSSFTILNSQHTCNGGGAGDNSLNKNTATYYVYSLGLLKASCIAASALNFKVQHQGNVSKISRSPKF